MAGENTFVIRARMPLDADGNPMPTALADHVQTVACTTGGWQHVEVPEGVSEACVWAVASGAATTIAFMYGGAKAGAPVTGATIPTGMMLTAHCAGAPYLYFKAVGAACDVQIQWLRKDI